MGNPHRLHGLHWYALGGCVTACHTQADEGQSPDAAAAALAVTAAGALDAAAVGAGSAGGCIGNAAGAAGAGNVA